MSGKGLKLSVWQDAPEETFAFYPFSLSFQIYDISKVSARWTGDFTLDTDSCRELVHARRLQQGVLIAKSLHELFHVGGCSWMMTIE